MKYFQCEKCNLIMGISEEINIREIVCCPRCRGESLNYKGVMKINQNSMRLNISQVFGIEDGYKKWGENKNAIAKSCNSSSKTVGKYLEMLRENNRIE